MPRLSIILPVFNPRLSFLKQSIESVIDDAPNDSELLIALDGKSSNDCENYLDKVTSQSSRLSVKILKEERSGIAGTLNKAIDQCDSEYIARQDSDDVVCIGRFKHQLEALQKNKDYSFCGGQIMRCNESLIPSIIQRRYPVTFEGQLIYSILLNNPLAHPTLLIRRNSLPKTVYRNVDGAEDWDLFVRMWESGHRSFNVETVCLRYRVHSNQITGKERDRRIIENLKERSLNAAIKVDKKFKAATPFLKISNSLRLTQLIIGAKGMKAF